MKVHAVKNQSRYRKWSWRFYLLVLLLPLLLAALVGRLLQLQVVDHERGATFLQQQGDARALRTAVIPASRGLITDRYGEPIAVSTPVKSLWMNPQDIDITPKALGAVAKSLGVSPRSLQSKVDEASAKEFAYVRRHMNPHDADAVLALDVDGLYGLQEYRRFYPAAEVTAHLLGFTNIDDQGQEGLELAFDNWLSGEPGSKQVLRDRRGRVIKEIKQLAAPAPGKDLALSIDLKLQYLAYRELKAAIQQYRARSGSIVLLDVHTGEVLALVNQPSFNANDRQQMAAKNVRNRALIDVFEPGSIVKPFAVAAALESGRYKASSKIDTNPGLIKVGSKTLVDPKNYGEIDLTTLLSKSSQVATSKLALSLDDGVMRDVFARVGFGEDCGTGFPGEQLGYLPDFNRWSDIDKAAFAYGHGLSVSVLQLARAYAVIANDGIKKPVSLLKVNTAPAGERVMSKDVANALRQMMIAVTESGGTGTKAQVSSFSVAGKTGTVHRLGKSGYEANRYRATFAGMVPADKPSLVAVVMVDDPKGEQYFGGEIAAPVFSRVMSGALRLLSVEPDGVVADRKGRKSDGSA